MNNPMPPSTQNKSLQDYLVCPPLKWGILGCGRVSHDFTQALKLIPNATVVGCAARNMSRAKEFAEKHSITNFYGNYDELINNPEIEVIYVGIIHNSRKSIGEKCLLGNKHTVLEKPFACNTADAEYLISLAKERNLFLMEGMWYRFFPAVQKARELVINDKSIGEVVSVYSDFNYNGSRYGDEYPTAFIYDWGLGGGATLLLGPYPISAALLFFDDAMPCEIKAVGQKDLQTGVDLQVGLTLSFASTSDVAPVMDNSITENTPKLPGSGIGVLTFGLLADTVEETTVIGTKGRLTISSPSHCPTKFTLFPNDADPIHYDFSLPQDTPEIEKAGGYFYPNSAGFAYEAAAVARHIASKKTVAPQMTLSNTLNSIKIMDESRSQLGVALLKEHS